MTRVCEICGQMEAQMDENVTAFEESFHLYVCEPCIIDLRWQE